MTSTETIGSEFTSKIPFKYNALGVFGTLTYLTEHLYFIDPLIKIFTSYKITNTSGFNLVIDPIITSTLIYILFTFKHFNKDTIIVKKFLIADLIYHIIEIILNFS